MSAVVALVAITACSANRYVHTVPGHEMVVELFAGEELLNGPAINQVDQCHRVFCFADFYGVTISTSRSDLRAVNPPTCDTFWITVIADGSCSLSSIAAS